MFAQTYGELLSIAPSKPIMIAETASTEEGKTTKKATWITDALNSLPTVFPAIRALVWFNWNIVEKGRTAVADRDLGIEPERVCEWDRQ